MAETSILGSGIGPHKIVELLGYPMEQQHKTLIIDLLVACAVIAFIVLPSICCQVSGPFMKPRDSWEDIIEKHRLKEKEKKSLLVKKKPIVNLKKND
jgi:hypothetical protein